jgi:hypothetical protein
MLPKLEFAILFKNVMHLDALVKMIWFTSMTVREDREKRSTASRDDRARDNRGI